ncbi:integrin beta-6-like [Bolinopsis microptera]|uniref:integrin beta-6-like n=1 Tax=Bolinopsis microptera TaxID=2820187 RepID=UPI0030793931
MVENQMIPIFGVTSKVLDLYRELRAFFPYGSVGELSGDSSNLVDLIVSEYRNISSKISPRLTESISGVNVEHVAKCPRNDYEGVTNGDCADVGIDEHAQFEFTVTADECFSAQKELTIEFTGFGRLTLNLDTLCECECASTEVTEGVCSGNGVEQCGACVCNDGWSDDLCNCPDGNLGNQTMCKMTPDGRICGGPSKGKCRCGECDCIPPNYGPFCQCNNEAERHCDCSGNGNCMCPEGTDKSVCVCEEGWTGDKCECTTNTETCMFNGFECDGHGTCNCGKCECEDNYSGKFCQQCEFCDKCTEFEECVLCVVGDSDTAGKNAEDCDACDIALNIYLTDERETPDSEEQWCDFEKDGCLYEYYYAQAPEEIQTTRQLLYINNDPDCGPINIIWVIVGVMLAIILMGIIIICCWKCVVMYKDKQEYKKFIEDMENTKFASTQSPLYNSPITYVDNPIARKM